jgi:hypothetical protein
MRSRTPVRGLSEDDPRLQPGRRAESVEEPMGKSAEDPSLLSVGQEAGDPRSQAGARAPDVDEGSSKAAEDPSATNW